MINNAYQYVNKGSWRALSFILAIIITLFFFFNINEFSTALRHQSPVWVLGILWATVILWIHGMGFDLRSNITKVVFFPYFGYAVGMIALANHFLF